MKRTAAAFLFHFRIFFSVCALLGSTAFVPATVKAINVTLDNPNQIVAAPTSGVTTLDFTGSVTIDTFFSALPPDLDNPSNASNSNTLVATLNSAFVTFASSTFGGTYTGSLFSVDVPAGTPADLYAFSFGSGASQLTMREYTAGGNTDEASAAFSVLVTVPVGGNGNGNGIPENGPALPLLALSSAALFFVRALLSQR